MVSHRAITNTMQTFEKEIHFFFYSVCRIVTGCSRRLTYKKQKICRKRIYLVIDDGLYEFYLLIINDGEFINY